MNKLINSLFSGKAYQPRFIGQLHCRHLPFISSNSGWVCDPEANACQLVCIENISEEHTINVFVDHNGDPLPMIDCHCTDVLNSATCQYFIDQEFDSQFTATDLQSFYRNSCAVSTTPAPTTLPPYWQKCGQLPELEVGYWSCHDTVCVLRCPGLKEFTLKQGTW